MRLRINKIRLENFKGLKIFEADFAGKDAVISAENGVGKTTIYDAYMWSLFGKDSSGRMDFGLRPLDSDNQPIKGLVLAVEVEIEVNGVTHTLRKENHEKVVKGQLRGYETICKIDEVPRKVGEYHEWVAETIPAEMFKMLTDLAHFNGKMNWPDRRKYLLDIAGKVSKPAGFDGLTATLNGRSIADYEKVLADRKKAYVKERDEINPRIDELQLGLDSYVQPSDSVADPAPGAVQGNLQAKREDLEEKINVLGCKRNDLLGKENERQGHNEHINRLTVKRLHRESELKNDTNGVQKLIDEKVSVEAGHAVKTQGLVNVQNEIRDLDAKTTSTQNVIDQLLQARESIWQEHQKLDTPNCALCGQKWPEGKERPGKKDVEDRANAVSSKIDRQQAELPDLQDDLICLTAKEKAMVANLKQSGQAKNARIAEIDKAIKNRPHADPRQDGKWQELSAEIEKVKALIGGPVSGQLEEIEAERGLAEERLKQMNEALAQADAIKKSKARIIELEAKEKDLAQKITEVERQLEEIDCYKAEQNKLIEAAVNGMFEHVEYKLFDYYLNEGYKPCCTALLNGVPYPDMSAGQKIYCGIDVINTLSDHYGVEVPLFIDHSESMTLPIEAKSQVIELFAQKGVTELQVSVVEKAVA